MNSVAIYMEGGGTGLATKDSLRRGMDGFLDELKQQCRRNGCRWKLVCCGSREQTFEKARLALQAGRADIVALLVDAESAVIGSPRKHLTLHDRWEMSAFSEHEVHLMVQSMETWLVAHPDALESFYGAGFRKAALPGSEDLERKSVADIHSALSRATGRTRKGKYHKIRHASILLGLIDPVLVRQRCPSCDRLFVLLKKALLEPG